MLYRLAKTRLDFRPLTFTSWGSIAKYSRNFYKNNTQCKVSIRIAPEILGAEI